MKNNFQISLFRNKKDNKPQIIKLTWDDLSNRFRYPKIRADKDGALFSPATFEPALRRKENVKSVSMLVLDIDHNADLKTLQTQLKILNSAYLIYSTHSHLRRTESNSNAEPRFRVVIPLSNPISGKDFSVLWRYVKHETNLPLDENAKDASRMFYVPAIAAPEAPYVCFIEKGELLDWQTLPPFSFVADGNHSNETNGNFQTNGTNNSQTPVFEYREDRHSELCRRIESQAKATGRGTFEMKCPAHNGKGDSSLFYAPDTKTVSCLKEPKCSYFEILDAFNLPSEHLPSREQIDKQKAEFEQSEIKSIPIPVPDEACFYGLAGDFVYLVKQHTEASPMALLAQFLVYFGNLVGRAAHFKIEGDKHYTNLFCVVIGKTAQGRKGTSFGRVKEVFKGIDEHHEKECLTSGLASGEGLLYQIRDAQYVKKKNNETGELVEVMVDGGVSDRRLLIFEGEFAQVLRVQGREGNTLSAFIRNLWDTGTARSLTKNSPLKTTDAHVSIIGHITKDELLLTLSEVESANGYANRFLFFAVERARFLPFGGDVPQTELKRLQDRMKEAIKYARGKGQMNFSIEASKLWAKTYPRLETSRFGYLAKVTQRASPYVLRLSLIFALLDKSPLIEKAHLEAALAVWQYAEDSARYIFGERLADPTAEKILTALKENQENGLTRTQIRELFDNHIKNEKLNAALSFLLENELARPRKEKTGGKKAEIWFTCVISVKSAESCEIDLEEKTFNANNAKNADSTIENYKIQECSNCGLSLELTEDKTEYFCPLGCGSISIQSFNPVTSQI